ncbi:MAG: excinuclease ABC subunit UvrC [Thermoguttaceae bacterium]|nr:excinuclease ABC subunit UvrC [Thermoguttaceae bacterium]
MSENQPWIDSGYDRPDGRHVGASDAPEGEAPAENAAPDFEFLEESEAKKIARGYRDASRKARLFPDAPGVYLMKDARDRVIYIGKAKSLKKRTRSYFLRPAMSDQRTAALVREIRDIDFLEAESEVDAILMEARLIKDIQPKYNRDLKDDKSFPYLQITVREEFPRVEITRSPRPHGVKLFGPFPTASLLRGALTALQKVFKFRTCGLVIKEGDPRLESYRPCVLASIGQCSAPCHWRITREEYRKNIRRLCAFLSGKRRKVVASMRREMRAASEDRQYEKAALLRDQLLALESLNKRGSVDRHVQPEVFQIDPRRGLRGLRQVFNLKEEPRVIEGVDIAHLSGKETVASVVRFIDGYPFKPGYRRYKIRSVDGVDDFASIAEVVTRRFSETERGNPPPDILLIDGGKGQLHAACRALEKTPLRPGMILSLAKREEEIFLPDRSESLRLSRDSWALRLLQYVRDESHRFAQHYHHILRRKATLGDE